MSNKDEHNDKKAEAEYNVFRDSTLRYMGYANEIGESFRYQFPRFVLPSYMMAFGYCSMDAISAGHREWTKENNANTSSTPEMNAALSAFDTLLWQTFASVLIPGGVINLIVRASRFSVAKTTLSPLVRKWIPTGAGILSIPLIIHPIDSFVDLAMDNTTRKLMFSKNKKAE